MYLLNGKKLPLGVEFQIKQSKYGAEWLQKSTPEDRAAIGITEVEEQMRPDDQYYWVTDNNDGTYTAVAKDLDILKEMVSNRINSQAFSLLAPTDYVEVLNLRDATYKPEWITWRNAIRSQAQAAKATVAKCKKVDTLIAASQVKWELNPTEAAKVIPAE